MLRALDRKLLRDLLDMKGQALAICLVLASGVATFVMSLTTLQSLRGMRDSYYERARFADVFATLKRAPQSLARQIAEIPGVQQVQMRVVAEVTLDVPDLPEPAVGRLISVPETRSPMMNDLHLSSGRYIAPGRRGEVLVSEAFAKARSLHEGDTITAVINGRRQTLHIVGIVLSPEYILQVRGGAAVPDDTRFGVFWMSYEELAPAYDMDGAFNDVTLRLMSGASEQEVIARLDELLERYGGVGAYARKDQASHFFLNSEIQGLRGMGMIVPSIFLGVAAFLLNVVMARLVGTQREQIAALKAFGYRNREIGIHYLKLVLLISLLGAAMGTAAGVWLGQGLSGLYAKFYRFPLFAYRFDWGVVALAVLISAGAAIVGTLGAVRRAVSLPAAEAMRPEPPATYRPTVVERLGLQRIFSQPARMVLRHLERRPVKAGLSLCGIALSVSILVVGNFINDALDYLIEFQFFTAQRQDMTLGFVEPTSGSVLYEIQHLPGVQEVEPFRSVPVKLRHEQRERRTSIMGLESDSSLYRLLDANERLVTLPPAGLVLSKTLARLLEVSVGQTVVVQVMEGRRPLRDIPVVGIIDEYSGTNAYMHIHALQRLMREQDAVSGAFITADAAHINRLYTLLKTAPRVADVTVKRASLESFEQTQAENQRIMQFFIAVFAAIIAFGVVYNTARISLAEHSRELATLRVIGLTRGEISAILLGELAVLSALAMPIGMIVGRLLAGLTAMAFDTELWRIPVVVTRWTYGFAATVTLAAAIFSGLVVRRKLDRLDLVAVLKSKE